MKNNRDKTETQTAQNEQRLARMLRVFDERRRRGDRSFEHESHNDLTPAELADLRGAQECLNLLEAVKPIAEGETDVNGNSTINQLNVERSPVTGDELVFDGAIPKQIGRFEIVKRLGSGGFGVVFRARDPQLDRDVALKVPRPETLLAENGPARFLREARAAAILSHPAIVPIYESGQIGPLNYIAFAFCDGVSLAQWFYDRDRKIDSRLAAQIVQRMADAVGHAHSRGVIHRDIKLANVLLDFGDSIGDDPGVIRAIRIADFGLASLSQSDELSLTRSGALVGTPSFMSPEQARGADQEIGRASDIYSLGASLYYLLAGRPPIKKDSDIQTLQAIGTEEPASLRRIHKSIPRDLEAICLKCLEKNPVNRYPTANDLSEDLQRHLDSQPVRARQITGVQRLARWFVRNPLVGSLAVAAISALLIGLVSTYIQYERAQSNLLTTRENYRQARAAVDDLLLAASDPALESLPDVRKKLLDRSLGYYSWFVAQDQDDPSLQMDRVTAYRNVAATALKLGAYKDSLNAYLQAQKLIDKLILDSSSRQDKLTGFQNRIDIGLMYDLEKQFAESKSEYERAISIGEGLDREYPDDSDVQASLARAYKNLGFVYREQLQFEKAMEFYQLALQIREQLVRQYPRDDEHLYRLAITHRTLVDWYVEQKQPDKALSAARTFHELSQRLLEFDLNDLRYRLNLATASNRLGDVYRNTRKPDNWSELAVQQYQQGAKIAQGLMDENPLLIGPKKELVNCRSNIADVYRNTKRPESAIENYELAIEVMLEMIERQPDSSSTFAVSLPQALHHKGTQYYLLGEFDRAREIFKSAADFIAQVLAKSEVYPQAENLRQQIYYQLGKLEYRTGNYQQSLAHLNKYHSVGGTNHRAQDYLARNLLYGGPDVRDAKRARDLLQEVIKISHKSIDGHINLAAAEFYAGNAEEASRILDIAKKLAGGEDRQGSFIRAVCAAKSGEQEAARKYFQQGNDWLEQQTDAEPHMLAEYRTLQTDAQCLIDAKSTVD